MILATHPFRRRSLNGLDENGNEGCATCGRRRGMHPAPSVEAQLLDLAHKRLEALFNPDSETVSALDSVMKRLFDPRERDLLTVSAFSSAL